MGSIKPVFLVLLFAGLQRSIPVYCQTHPSSYSLTENGASLEQVLTDIRDKWGYTFFGQGDWPKLAHSLTFSVKNVSLQQILDICFKDQPLHYTFKDDAIIITIKPTKDGWVHGYVLNQKKEPVPGTTVAVRGGGPTDATATNENGEFRIHVHYADTWVVISNVNFKSVEMPVEPGKDITVELEENIAELVNVAVMGYRTGYQTVKASTATGSFDKVDSELISRRVSPNILDRIDGVTSSVLFNKNSPIGANPSAITIRGRSTIFANPEPLVVVDNFPYTGDINNINPDDVESITVLKDAAAASIWGAFSGNGVIVITTKKGRYGQAPQVSFNTSLTVGNKPNLYYTPILSSSDYIDVEDSLFHWGNYTQLIDGFTHPALTPVVELLLADSLGLLSDANAQLKINALRGVDTRRDLEKYFYQPSFNQQYSLHLTGGGPGNQYYLSGGYDRDMSNMVRNEYNRLTINGNNSYCIVPNKLEFNFSVAFTASTTYNNNSGGSAAGYPYQQLADAQGHALPVNFALRESYFDTADMHQLLDWHYRPLDELHNADNTTHLTDYRINLGGNYTIGKGFHANVYYQYGRGNTDIQNYQNQLTYYTRNLINEFTQPGPNGSLIYAVPLGGILDESVTSYMANYIRVQLNYDNNHFLHGVLNMIGGAEVRDVEGNIRTTRLYGYNREQASSSPVDYTTVFPQFSSGTGEKIPYQDQNIGTSDRFVSYYLNGSYTYQHRYTVSASGRRDESNLFGVNANQKGVPLWSVGGAWDISREHFYPLHWLPFLKLRLSDGYNGNVDRSVSAFTTASINTGTNIYGATNASIINPPNPDLRWERIHILNTAIDFAGKGDRVGGTIEYYIKSGLDLIGQSPVDPTTGVTQFTSNTADMRAHGWDFSLHSNTDIGPVKWNSVLLFSFVEDRMTKYEVKQGAAINYVSPSTLNPLVGRPLYSTYAFRWMGLDPGSGSPQGWYNGKISIDYNTIVNSSDLSNLIYKGPTNPPFFGSWRNSFYWKNWGLSFNVLYKFGYVFRRNSIFYSTLFEGITAGHPDYEKRWQKPGDEKFTNVPSMVYPDPATNSRDEFYQYSETLIEKGDHIRLQDIQFSYDLTRKIMPWMPVQSIRFYCYANNIGILWKANHQGVDPDYINSIPNPRTIALGLKMDF